MYLCTDESVWIADSIVPVELLSFTASANDDKVTLNWTTATETNNKGFEIQRSKKSKLKSKKEWEKVGFVEGSGTTTEKQEYSFPDKNITSGKYNYRLKQIDYDGTYKY